MVDRFLEVVGWPGVWALGDCAAVPDAATGKTSAPTAQHALREERVLARNLTADIRGQSKKPFVFSTIGQLAAIGKRTGVANIFGFNFLRFHCIGALAVHLLEQIAEIGKETARGSELELGLAVFEGYCGVSYGLRNHCVSNYA